MNALYFTNAALILSINFIPWLAIGSANVNDKYLRPLLWKSCITKSTEESMQ